jgi:hypothetical protein
MSGYRFLYWDDYETPKGNNTGATPQPAHTPEDDPAQPRRGEDSV